MMENFTEKIGQLLGKGVNDSELLQLLASLGETGKIEPDPDTGSTYVSRQNLGFSLLLADPIRVKNPAFSSMTREFPILRACFYYSQGHDGYQQFEGRLPWGLEFADTRSLIVTKLGEPSWKREKNGRTVAEKWIRNNRSIHITYKKNLEGILVLSFGLGESF